MMRGIRNASDLPVYLTAAAICAVLTLATWAVVVAPALREHRAGVARVAELSRQRHKAATLRTALAAARREIDQIETATRKARPSLDPATLVNTHMARITAAANACGLNVEELQPGKAADTPYYKAIELRIAGSGTFPQVTRFLHRVHEDFADSGVRSIELTAGSGNALSPPANFRLGLIWFAAPAPPDSGQAATPVANGQ